MFKYCWIITLYLLVVSCSNKKLTISKGKISDKLGIRLINNANIQEDDWQYFTTTTDSFIGKFNANKHRFRLYSSVADSNSICLDFRENYYVTKNKQVLSAIITAAGITTPILLLASNASIIVAFWYTPRNKTILFSSLSKDLDSTKFNLYHVIQTKHQFQSLAKQKEKQKIAYFDFLDNFVNEFELVESSTIVDSDVAYPDKIVLNDSREITCKIIKTDNEAVYFKFIKDDRMVETLVYKDKITTIQRGISKLK